MHVCRAELSVAGEEVLGCCLVWAPDHRKCRWCYITQLLCPDADVDGSVVWLRAVLAVPIVVNVTLVLRSLQVLS